MRKNSFSKRIIVLFLVLTILIINNVALAAFWATPGYEWALSNRLTSVKSNYQLNRTVSLSDFYSTAIKYLRMKGIKPTGEEIHHEDEMEEIDNVAKGIFEIINSYNEKDSLTLQQFYIVENYINHARKTLEDYKKYSQYLTRDSLKNIDLYLTLSKYKAATLVEKRTDREFALRRVGYIKNAEIIDYNVIPYAEELTRKEFLLVMYDLISETEQDGENVLNAFKEAGVLVGFDTGLELDKKITYSEMYTFLYRFEIFDFDGETEENEETLE